MSHQAKPEEPPEGAEKAVQWRALLRSFMQKGKPVVDTFARVWDLLDQVSSPLGEYVKSCKGHRVPPDVNVQNSRGNDLLPLSPLVMDRFTAVPEALRSAMKLSLVVLNFLAMGGCYNQSRDVPPLRSCQKDRR